MDEVSLTKTVLDKERLTVILENEEGNGVVTRLEFLEVELAMILEENQVVWFVRTKLGMGARESICVSFIALSPLEEPVEAVFDGKLDGPRRFERLVAGADLQEIKQGAGTFAEDRHPTAVTR